MHKRKLNIFYKLLSVLFAGEHVSVLCGDAGQDDGVCCTQRRLRGVGRETVSQHVSGERKTKIQLCLLLCCAGI